MFGLRRNVRWGKSWLLIGAMAIALWAASSSPARATTPVFGPGLGASVPAVAASFGREVFPYHSALSTSQEANLYRVMILQSNNTSVVAPLHTANPHLKLFAYQDAFLGRSGDPQGVTACSDYPSISASQPSWFLKDQHGNRILDKAYAGDYVMDVGIPAYQQSCVAHAIALAKAGGFDGVYFDDSSPNVGWVLSTGVTVPKYPTPAAWQAAEYSFLQYASAQLHAAHLLFMGNIGGSANYPGLWAKWGALMDGSEEQSFTNSNSGIAASLWAWPAQLANAAWSQANGKYALLHSYSTNETGNTFGLATMLLVGNGDDLYSTANANFSTDEEWYPEYTLAEGFGSPSGAYTKLSNGVYKRVFAKGVVLVNPTTSSVGTFSLGGGIYSGSGVSKVKSVSLAPASALILARVG